jgi:hypothetical protein
MALRVNIITDRPSKCLSMAYGETIDATAKTPLNLRQALALRQLGW